MYSLVTTTPPASEPVTKAEFKLWARLDDADTTEDDLITSLITAARIRFEVETGRTVLPTVYTQHLDCWPDQGEPIRLARSNVTGVTSVNYYDADDNAQVIAAYSSGVGYRLDTTGLVALVYLPDQDWPTLSTLRSRPANVVFTAGWASSSAVPSDVKLAIKLVAAHYYMVRENYTETPYRELPMGFRFLCDFYRNCMGGV